MPIRLQTMLRLAKIWAYPLWWGVRHAGVADVVEYDVSRWVRCIGDDKLIQLGTYDRFAFLVGARQNSGRRSTTGYGPHPFRFERYCGPSITASEP